MHAEIAGEMVVADAGLPQRRLFGARLRTGMTGPRRDPDDGFDHRGNIGAREPVIAVPALLLDRNEAAGLHLG